MSYYKDKSNRIALSLFLLFTIAISGLSDEYPESKEGTKDENNGLEIYYSVKADFNTRYIWRGIPFSERVVREFSK